MSFPSTVPFCSAFLPEASFNPQTSTDTSAVAIGSWLANLQLLDFPDLDRNFLGGQGAELVQNPCGRDHLGF
jgi:hypothetical protein